MHDTVTVWADDGKQKVKKHYLVMHLQEAHQLFCQLYPTEGDGNIISSAVSVPRMSTMSM